MDSVHWSQLAKTSDGRFTTLSHNNQQLATLTLSSDSEPSLLVVGEQQWLVNEGDKHQLQATLPSAEVFTATPVDKKVIGRAKEIELDISGRSYRFINEAKTDWIVKDPDNIKIAQFTGFNNGVRHPSLELEDDVEIDRETLVFLAWASRVTLQARMLGTTEVLTISLALLTPFILLVYLL